MELHSIGINYTHKNGIIIDRPHGSGDNLLIIFKTPATAVLNGEAIKVSPNSAIVYAKNTPQLYGNENELYLNHCIHMDCDEADDIHKRSGLKFDTVFPLLDTDKIEALMKDISYEFYSGNDTGTEIALLLLRVLIFKLGESCSFYITDGKNKEKISHEKELKKLRSEIYSTPSSELSVKEMAKRLNISTAHFQRLYKAAFGISSYEDVIKARIALAEYYLRTTDINIGNIAFLCGYESCEHFMRQFKQKTGCTPSQYRTGN